jgi:hypothetical protein
MEDGRGRGGGRWRDLNCTSAMHNAQSAVHYTYYKCVIVFP